MSSIIPYVSLNYNPVLDLEIKTLNNLKRNASNYGLQTINGPQNHWSRSQPMCFKWKIEEKTSGYVTHKKVNTGLQIYVRQRENKMW